MAAPAIEKTPIKRRTPQLRAPGRAGAWTVPTRLSMEERRMLVSVRPITFEEWLDRGGKEVYELVRGSLVEKLSASIEHEWLFSWMYNLLGTYVQHKGLGVVLGSRTGVRVSEFDGRLPDIVFINKERFSIVHPKG